MRSKSGRAGALARMDHMGYSVEISIYTANIVKKEKPA